MTAELVPPEMPVGDAGSAGALATRANQPRDPAEEPRGEKILIVEDDVSLGKFLSRALKLKLFSVEVALDGETAWETLQNSNYDLVILDLNLPRIDGMELLRRLRQIQPGLRVLVLTARNRTEDLVLALEQGADDCLIKPFSFLELLARIRGLLRRAASPATSASTIGDLRIDREQRRAVRGERTIHLTPREFAILECLMDNAGKTVSRMMLMRDVWNIPFDPSTNIVDVYWSTTGLSEMDWFIADPFFLPSMEAHFTEGVWRLPRVAACYRGDPSLPESSWIPDTDGTIWLGSFNRYGKIRRDTLCLWAKVFCALPEAKLLLEDRAPCEEETHARIRATLLEQGVSAERITFVAPIHDHRQHMALYDRLDIALDTIPFNSGTTAYDALWMGVPIVALEGNWNGARLVSAALKAFDHRHWIAQTEQEYVSIVCSLARDVDGRKRLRKTQRSRMAASPLCDANDIARVLEEALEAMYDARVAGPRH